MPEQDTRLRNLNQDELIQLQKIYEDGISFGASFWINVEKALTEEYPLLELHKCLCGAILLMSREYIEKAKKEFSLSDAKCWHAQNLDNSISYLNSNVKRRVEKISMLLRENNDAAYTLGIGLLPIDSPSNFDYSLWKLQHVLMAQEYYKKNPSSKRSDYQYQYTKSLFLFFEKAKKNNSTEYKKLIQKFTSDSSNYMESMEIALNKRIEATNILEDEAYRRVSNMFTPTRRINRQNPESSEKVSLQAEIDAYQAYFEIKEFLFFLFNMIKVYRGEKILDDPFKGEQVNNKPIGNKKGLMIEKIIQELPNKKMQAIIKQTYNPKFRNDTSGHNDYIIDLKTRKIHIRSKNKAYSINYFTDVLSRMVAYTNAILSLGNLAPYDEMEILLSLMGVHSMFLHFNKENDKPENVLTFYQHWTNAELDTKGDNFNMLHFTLTKDRKLMLFSPSSVMPVPGAAIILPTKTHLRWLEEVVKNEEVLFRRFVISPKIEYFLSSAKGESSFSGIEDFFVLAETQHKAKVFKPKLRKVIKLLKKQKLPDDSPNRTFEFVKELNKYNK